MLGIASGSKRRRRAALTALNLVSFFFRLILRHHVREPSSNPLVRFAASPQPLSTASQQSSAVLTTLLPRRLLLRAGGAIVHRAPRAVSRMSSAAPTDAPPSHSPPSLAYWYADLSASQAIPLPKMGPSLITADDPPLASLGVLTDIQYAPQENGQDYLKTETRYFRHAIVAAEAAVQDMLETAKSNQAPLHYVLHLGDLVDGTNEPKGKSKEALDELLTRLPPVAITRSKKEPSSSSAASAELSMYHVIGNHELVNLPRKLWADRLGMGDLAKRSIAEAEQRGSIENVELNLDEPVMFPEQPIKPAATNSDGDEKFLNSDPLYYDFTVADGLYRFIMLDAYDIAISGRDSGDPVVAQATSILKHFNRNENLFAPYGDSHETRRFVAFNGGMGERQLKWLVNVLEDALVHRQFVVLCSHVSFSARVTANYLQIWNQHELLQLVHRYPHIVACLHGHSHGFGHIQDDDGVHHHVFEAILTTPEERRCHGRLDLYADRIELRGVDMMKSCRMPFAERAKKWHEATEE
jgi:manganese-dependent ADP-ribose/CDP-alcohol diphosphatase